MRQSARPASPCVSQCKLDPQKTTCEGCGRTIEEIRQWRYMPQQKKDAVWLRLSSEGRIS